MCKNCFGFDFRLQKENRNEMTCNNKNEGQEWEGKIEKNIGKYGGQNWKLKSNDFVPLQDRLQQKTEE